MTDEQLDRLDAGGPRCLDKILALGGEEPGLSAVTLLGEPPDELERGVVARGDHGSRQSSQAPW